MFGKNERLRLTSAAMAPPPTNVPWSPPASRNAWHTTELSGMPPMRIPTAAWVLSRPVALLMSSGSGTRMSSSRKTTRSQPSMWLSIRPRLRFALRSDRCSKTVPASNRDVSRSGSRRWAGSGTSIAIRSTRRSTNRMASLAHVHFPLCRVTSGQPRRSAARAASLREATRRVVGTMIASTFARGTDSSAGQTRRWCDPWWSGVLAPAIARA